MGFKKDSNTGNKGANNNQRGQDDSWKAGGFINLYLPGPNGTKKKLAGIPLRKENEKEAALLEWLKEDPARIAVVIAKLQADFQVVDEATAGFDLGALAA